MSTEVPALLTVPQACDLLGGVSRTTVFRLIRDEGLPHVKVRRRLLFPAEQVGLWIAARTVGAVAV